MILTYSNSFSCNYRVKINSGALLAVFTLHVILNSENSRDCMEDVQHELYNPINLLPFSKISSREHIQCLAYDVAI